MFLNFLKRTSSLVASVILLGCSFNYLASAYRVKVYFHVSETCEDSIRTELKDDRKFSYLLESIQLVISKGRNLLFIVNTSNEKNCSQISNKNITKYEISEGDKSFDDQLFIEVHTGNPISVFGDEGYDRVIKLGHFDRLTTENFLQILHFQLELIKNANKIEELKIKINEKN